MARMTHLTEILGVKESFELTDKLMSALADPAARVSLFERYLAPAPDLSCDHFLDEFQQSAAVTAARRRQRIWMHSAVRST